jgi:hypothetical protein
MIFAMNESNDETTNDQIPIQSEKIAYSADELVACRKCSRTNPPTRLDCVYCGAELDVSPDMAGLVKPALRKLEDWEKGFNLIVAPAEPVDIAEIARTFKIQPETVKRIFELQRHLPIARVGSVKECEILQQLLEKSGIGSKIVTDESLAPDIAPRRLRGIEFEGDAVVFGLFSDGPKVRIASGEIEVIVTGAVFEKAVEAIEKRKKGKTLIVDASETASDEPLIDVYIKNTPLGFRITTTGFDFSCLGSEKGILARENMKKLIRKFAEIAPQAAVVDDYIKIRDVLGEVWETDTRRESKGMKRSSFGKFDLASVASSSNLRQFNRWSRLQRQIL